MDKVAAGIGCPVNISSLENPCVTHAFFFLRCDSRAADRERMLGVVVAAE